MDKDKISKNTWAVMALTAILSIFGGWSAGTEKQSENTRKISVLEVKCEAQEENDADDRKVDEEIIKKLDALIVDVGEMKSDVKLLNATKADRKYEN